MTSGSPILKDFMPPADSVMVERMRKAGAIFIGKTNTPEFGLGSHTYNPVYGATRNAYDLTRSAGGSSGGAAVALALRMLPVADGTDYGGSLRNPAGWNNVFGFRTSFGLVPADGRDVWLPSMGVRGPMARNVRRSRHAAVGAGRLRRPRAAVARRATARFPRPLEADLKGKRIAWLGDFGGYMSLRGRRAGRLQDGAEDFRGDWAASWRRPCPTIPSTPSGRPSCKLRPWQTGGTLLPFYQRSGQARAAEARSGLGDRERPEALRLRHHRGLGRAHGVVPRGAALLRALRLSSSCRPRSSFRSTIERTWPHEIAGTDDARPITNG